MKENYFFETTRDQIGEDKKEETKPQTEQEYTDESRPMVLKDHWLTLRGSIQEKTGSGKMEEGVEEIKTLEKLVTPEISKEYRDIIESFKDKGKKTKNHTQREFIDINEDEKTSDRIEAWVNNLVTEVHSKKEGGLKDEEKEELAAQSWMLFDSVANVLNTKFVEADILDFCKDTDFKKLKPQEQKTKKGELFEDLQQRYPVNKSEAEILFELTTKDNKEEFSAKILAETLAKLWQEHKLGDKKAEMAKISGGYLLAKGLQSFAPSLFKDLFTGDKFNAMVGLEYVGLNEAARIADLKADIRSQKLMSEISQEINGRITNSLFFQEFEFIHDRSLGEIYERLEKGKSSTTQLIQDFSTRFGPAMAGIGMSAGFLTAINPILGTVGMAGLPIMAMIAKRRGEAMAKMHQQGREKQEEIAKNLESIKSGFEIVKTSPNASDIAEEVKGQMNASDKHSLEMSVQASKDNYWQMAPYVVSMVVAGGVGYGLQEAGVISGGAILSNINYSFRLNAPVERLMDLYYRDFPKYVKDIKRMDEILGKYEQLDLPEGKKEKERVPVTELPNYDISIRDLRYKKILKGIDLDIKQGEFLTISGASGAGKSTLLRNLVGLFKPDGGEITIGGFRNDKIKKYGPESLGSVMSYCNQSPQMFEGMTLRENLLLWAKEGADDEKIKQVLKELHLDSFADRLDEKIKHFSGGEKVRMGVARTLIKGAKIMLLDEPTASLDSTAAAEVRRLIGEIHEKHPETTIICVSHDEDLAKMSKRPINLTDLQKKK